MATKALAVLQLGLVYFADRRNAELCVGVNLNLTDIGVTMEPVLRGPFRTAEALEAAYAKGLLRKTDLVHGQYYQGFSYNATIARWHEGAQCFVYVQTKATTLRYETTKHPADERYFDVFCVTDRVEPGPEEVLDDALFEAAVIPKKPKGITMLTPLQTDEELEAAYTQGLLRKSALVHGQYYYGLCRNAQVARWHAGAERFVYERRKLGGTFYEVIKHPQDERYYDVFRVTRLAEPAQEQQLVDERFEQAATTGGRA